ATGAARVEPGVARDAFLHHLADRKSACRRILRADEPRERLLQKFIPTEAKKSRYGIVGLKDFTFEVRDEHRVWSILDEALGVGTGLVQFAHVAEDANGANDTTIRVA